MENKKIIILRCALSLTAVITMLSFALPTLTIKPANECDACKDAIKVIEQENKARQNKSICTWRGNEA